MKHPERVEDYLEHIAKAIYWASQFIERLDSFEAFENSRRDQDAVVRNMEIIGEAAGRIQQNAPDFARAHPELPWIQMRGMRNKLIHHYFDVQLDVVWNTVKNDLPGLKRQIDSLLLEYRNSSNLTSQEQQA